MTLAELIAKREALLDKMRSLLNLADGKVLADGTDAPEGTASRDLTDEETVEYDAWDKDVEKMTKDIARREKLEADEARAAAAGDNPHTPDFPNTRTRQHSAEFENLEEFLHSVAFRRGDPRLQDAWVEGVLPATGDARDSTMGTGTEGGFAVPTQFRPELLSVDPAESIFQPMSTLIPAGSPPDAEVEMPTLDQTANQNVYGGVVMYKIGEGIAPNESNIRLKKLSLTPEGLGGYVQITDKLLRNWSAAAAVVPTQLRKALAGYKDTQFYSGNGIAGPLGVIKARARIDVARGTATTIVKADIDNMMARMKWGGSLMWVASQTCFTQFTALVDAASRNIFQFDASKAIPASLHGAPLRFHDRSLPLGTKGDLILVDMAYYLVKEGSGPFVDISKNVGDTFLSGITTFKIVDNIDGKPWLTAPLPLEGSTDNTVSPFVVLK